MPAITDEDIEELRKRNAARLEEMKRSMGRQYLLHPDNQVTRKGYQKQIRQVRKHQVSPA